MSFLKFVPIYFRVFSAILNVTASININTFRFYIYSYAIFLSFFSSPKEFVHFISVLNFFFWHRVILIFLIISVGSVVMSLSFLLGKWCLLFVSWPVLLSLYVSMKQHLPLLIVSIGYCSCIYIFSLFLSSFALMEIYYYIFFISLTFYVNVFIYF